MTIIFYSFALILFCIVFKYSNIKANVYRAIDTTKESASIIIDKRLNDQAKEKKIQKAAIKMIKLAFLITLKATACIITATIPLWIADSLKLVLLSEITVFALRIDVLMITTFLLIGGTYATKKLVNRNSQT